MMVIFSVECFPSGHDDELTLEIQLQSFEYQDQKSTKKTTATVAEIVRIQDQQGTTQWRNSVCTGGTSVLSPKKISSSQKALSTIPVWRGSTFIIFPSYI